MLKRQHYTMRLVRGGLAISVLLHVLIFKWALLTAFVDLPVDVDSLFPPVTSWTIATGILEFIAAILMATASTKGKSSIFILANRWLKYCFLMQLVVSSLALAVSGIANPLVLSDLCRFLVLISLLVLIDFDHGLTSTRDQARLARRAALKNRLQRSPVHMNAASSIS